MPGPHHDVIACRLPQWVFKRQRTRKALRAHRSPRDELQHTSSPYHPSFSRAKTPDNFLMTTTQVTPWATCTHPLAHPLTISDVPNTPQSLLSLVTALTLSGSWLMMGCTEWSSDAPLSRSGAECGDHELSNGWLWSGARNLETPFFFVNKAERRKRPPALVAESLLFLTVWVFSWMNSDLNFKLVILNYVYISV